MPAPARTSESARSGTGSAASRVSAEEAALGPGVGVVVVGDVAHVTVDVILAELGRRDLTQPLAHVGQVLGRRLRAVPAPDDHRHLADLALRDPADVVLVKPRRQLLGPAQIAALDFDEAVFAHEAIGYATE